MLHRALVLFAVASAAIGLSGCTAQDAQTGAASEPRSLTSPASDGSDQRATGTPARVAAIIDGDTMHARLASGKVERVRLIGIDAPEASTTRTGYAQCGGAQATQALRQLAPIGSEVRLTTDTVQDRRDRFGRLLAYVRTEASGRATVQELLLRAGWARVYVYDRRPFTRVSRFRAAADAARDAGRGVWRACDGDFRRPAR